MMAQDRPLSPINALSEAGTELTQLHKTTITHTKSASSADTNFLKQDREDVEIQTDGVAVARMEEMALKALHTDDDPSLNPWTLRVLFIGFSLSFFGSALSTIFLFKPQGISISIIFLTLISYVGGAGLASVLPTRGRVGHWLNPHPFNCKEHLAIVIMSSSASSAAYATEVLATQKLYYNTVPNAGVAVLLLFSSQLLGYGMAGVLRKSLVYPTKMLHPGSLPTATLIETLHRNKADMKNKFKYFWIILLAVFIYQWFPQFIMPILTGISVFCLANRKSLVFTNIFGGTNSNEGLGFMSLCFDWQYVGIGAFFIPLQTLANSFIGYIFCICLFAGLYYGNIWEATRFPFLSQQIFSGNSTANEFIVYNQTSILTPGFELDASRLETQGLPFFAATHASSLLTTNLGLAASFVHVCLWNKDVVKDAFTVDFKWLAASMRSLRQSRQGQARAAMTEEELDRLDPHYRKMLAYKEVPSWWYALLLVLSIALSLIGIYDLDSTLPWWGFLTAITLAFCATLFLGAMTGLFGFRVPITPVIQLIGGYIIPGKPVANMYFVLFGANSQAQALHLVENLKLGQYGKLSPRCTFFFQILGTLCGAAINFLVMDSITTSQRQVLLSIQGTNVWSGVHIQSFNSNAIAFGALSRYLFRPGGLYQWIVLALPVGLFIPIPFYLLHQHVPKLQLNYLVTPIFLWYMGSLSGGINSSDGIRFALGFFVQCYVRRRHPKWFVKYNYLTAAAISGGVELMVFLSTFAVQGASGKPARFPPYWGNNFHKGHFDYCTNNPAF